MALYRFRVKTSDGKDQEGTLESPDLKQAVHTLSLQGLQVLSLSKVPPESSGWGRKITDTDLSQISRKLASLAEMGAPLANSLTIITAEIHNRQLKNVLKQIQSDLLAGHPLSKAMARFGHIFSQFHISMIEAGEQSGTLPHMLYRMADLWQKQAYLRSRIRSLLVYPFCILFVMVFFGVIFRFWLFPQLISLYPDPDEVPLVSRIFLILLDSMVIVLPIIFFGALLLWYLSHRSYGFRLKVSRLLFKIPIARRLVREIVASRFSRTFGMLLRGGMDATEAIHLSARVVGFTHAQRELAGAADLVASGHSISDSIEATNVVPADMVLALSLSEDRGSMSQDLLEMADNHDRLVEERLNSMLAVLEPGILVMVGLFVGLCALSAWLPYIWMIPSVGPTGGIR